MCFKNLPIEFDEQGKAHLTEGFEEAYAITAQPRSLVRKPPPQPSGSLKDFTIDPITRVAGALGIHTVIDEEQRTAVEAHSMATLFRGYELILKGRDPRDAIDISSRACGVCGGVHSTCSSLALEMAFPVVPPPLGVVARNLGEAAEFLYDHPLHLGLLAGPDYSAAVVEVTNPELLRKARDTLAPHADIHGYKTIGDIMEGMNPLTGSIYLESLEITRVAKEACVLMYGKYPHPSTLVAGGVTTTLSTSSFNEYHTRLYKLIDYSKKLVGLWDDIVDFFYEANPRYKEVGARPKNLIQLGIWDNEEYYDATYANVNEWGEKRWSSPGVIIDGELRTTKLQQINIGIEEFVEHSYYDDWVEGNGHKPFMETDPAGNPLSPYHPWNKDTRPKPQARSWKEKYTWATAPRWDRQVVETGPYGRLWVTAMTRLQPENSFIFPEGDRLRMVLPKAMLPEMELTWKIPEVWNAFERNRGRAYAQAFTALVALNNLLRAFALWRKGETKVHTRFSVPQKGTQVGVGFWEAGRGYLAHHCILENGRIRNYQITTPSTFMASPHDPFGNPGPYEEAIIGTPILESVQELKGIDILRTVRSFDPCMPCTVHMETGQGVITREVNSCACTLE